MADRCGKQVREGFWPFRMRQCQLKAVGGTLLCCRHTGGWSPRPRGPRVDPPDVPAVCESERAARLLLRAIFFGIGPRETGA